MRYFNLREYQDLLKVRAKKAHRRKGQLTNSRLISMETVSEVEWYNIAHDNDLRNRYNQAVADWQEKVAAHLRSKIIVKSKRIARELSPKVYTDKYGLINRLGFSFPRHGVYIHYGAGKGYGGTIGSSWTKLKRVNGVEVSTGIVRHTNPSSLDGSMGTGPRRAYRWFDPVIKQHLPELMDIVTQYFDTMIIDASKIFIEK